MFNARTLAHLIDFALLGCAALTLTLFGMHITGLVDWPWYVILAPLLTPMGLLALLFLFCVTMAVIAGDPD